MIGKLFKIKALLAFGIAFITSGCSQIELASHYTKKFLGPSYKFHSSSKGNYKIGSPYRIAGRKYYPKEDFYLVETGVASWYGPDFHGGKTANGETYNQYAMTAAHKTLQLPAIVKVTNLENGRSVVVRVNDRGPYAKGRIIDVSKAAAKKLGMIRKGTARVRIQVLTKESKLAAKMAKAGYDTSKMDYAWIKRQLNINSINNVAYNDIRQPQNNYRHTPEIAYLKNDARLDYEYVPMGNINEPYLPESLQRPVIISESKPAIKVNKNNNVVKNDNVYIQAGAFSIYDNADRLGQKLSRLAPVDISEINVRNRTLYRVRLGPVNSVQEARVLEQDIKNLGYDAPVKIMVGN